MSDIITSRERCGRCRFWCEEPRHRDDLDAGGGFGLCRRRPPLLSESLMAAMMPPPRYGEQVNLGFDAVELAQRSRFPGTYSRDWCGVFEAIGSDQVVA